MRSDKQSHVTNITANLKEMIGRPDRSKISGSLRHIGDSSVILHYRRGYAEERLRSRRCRGLPKGQPKRDRSDAGTSHFALETHVVEIAAAMRRLLKHQPE